MRNQFNLVCIYIESKDGMINQDCTELIALSNKFKREYGFITCGISIGNTKEVTELYEALGDLELDDIYIKHGDGISYYDELSYTDILYKFSTEHKPLLVLGCNTVHSKAVLSRYSYRSNGGMCADCIDFWFDNNKVYTTRPVYNGTMFANICMQENSCMVCTVRKNLFDYVRESDIKPSLHVENSGSIYQSNQYIVNILNELISDKVQNKIMIGIGNGIGNIDNVNNVLQLAKVVSADVGGTRIVIENGWLPKHYQIGLSGKILKNYGLYIAIGISGAYQHVCGVMDCKKIVAINDDEKCDMFKYSDIGIVGDVEEALAVFNKVFNERC